MIIDTHIHLYDQQYQSDFSQIIDEAFAADVRKMIVVGYDYESSLKAINLAEKHDFLYAAVGLHPSEVAKEKDYELKWLKDLALHPRVVAVGEAGLDYYWDKSYTELQKRYFIAQIKISEQRELPIIVHSRDASADTYQILTANPIPGVLHCYSMSLELAREFVKGGYYLGIGGVLTFKNSKEIKNVVQAISIKHLLTETDGPYLAPEPYRGRLNKPSYLKYVVEKIAEIKGMPVNEVIADLEKNVKKLFAI
ncbi:MAG: TatD family hydrolase [Bacilli bacterium]|nr:TatD family hydrolase [Bacilli bacterium]